MAQTNGLYKTGILANTLSKRKTHQSNDLYPAPSKQQLHYISDILVGQDKD